MTSPHNNDGPFVSNNRGPGLLRKLLGGGSNDPTSPHTHDADLSTSQMHDQPLARTTQATPVAPKASPFGMAGTDTFGGAPANGQRPIVIRLLLWLLRHPRIAITVGALLLVFIGQFSDGKTKLEQASADLQDMQTQLEEGTFSSSDIDIPEINLADPAVPDDITRASSFRATITKVRGEDVTIGSGAGAFTWKIGSPSVYAVLTRNLNEEVLLHWELRGSEIYVVGVDGPNGTVAPPKPEAPTPPAAPAG